MAEKPRESQVIADRNPWRFDCKKT